MSKQSSLNAVVGLALALAASTAWAERNGWYLGVTAGEAQSDLNRGELHDALINRFVYSGVSVVRGTSSLEDSDTSFSLLGGYRFTPYFALEAGYLDLGTAQFRSSNRVDPPGPVTPETVSYSADYETTGFTLAALGTILLGERFDLHGQAGVLFAEREVSQAFAVVGTSSSLVYSTDSRDFFYGLGAGLHLGERWSLGLDWQQFQDVGDRLSLGVTFRL